MNDKLKALLVKLGMTTTQITEFEVPETAEKIVVDDLYKTVTENLAESLKNTASFIDPIRNSVRGEVLSSKERKLMKLYGISQDEYDALPKESKFDSLTELAHKKLKAASAGSGDNAAEIEKLQKQLADQREANKQAKLDAENEKLRVDLKLQQIDTKQALKTAMRKSLGKDNILIPAEDFAFVAATNQIEQNYDLKLVENKLVVKQKGTDLDAYLDNVKVTAEQLYLANLTENKLIQKSNGNPTPPRTGAPAADEKKFVLPGMQLAEQRAAQDAAKD